MLFQPFSYTSAALFQRVGIEGKLPDISFFMLSLDSAGPQISYVSEKRGLQKGTRTLAGGIPPGESPSSFVGSVPCRMFGPPAARYVIDPLKFWTRDCPDDEIAR